VGALRNLLPQVGRPLSELVLVATGDVVLVFHDETVFEAITGQEWVFPVAAFEREVSDFRIRQEADARLRHEAEARLRRDASGRKAEASRRPARRAPVEPVLRDEPEASRPARPAKPSVRSAQQNRKRWSRTG